MLRGSIRPLKRFMKFPHPRIVPIALAFGLLAIAQAPAANLVLNGSFESGAGPIPDLSPPSSYSIAWDGSPVVFSSTSSITVDDWAFTGDPSTQWVDLVYGDSSANYNWMPGSTAIGGSDAILSAQDGGSFVRMDTLASIDQTLATTPGQEYQLSFYVGTDGTWADGAQMSSTQSLNVVLGGLGIGTYSVTAAGTGMVWRQYTYNFIASSTATGLAFSGVSDSSGRKYAGLDNVSVVPVPEVSTFLLSGMAVVAWVSFRRR